MANDKLDVFVDSLSMSNAVISNSAVSVKELREAITLATAKEETKTTEEEWIWVEGYKGTDENMCCRGYQFKLGERHTMPADAKIVMCESGFHLCLNLKDVLSFYAVDNGNRFFRVKALVRKRDYENYGKYDESSPFSWFLGNTSRDKLVAMSIDFMSELTTDEIFDLLDVEKYSDWTREEKELARSRGFGAAQKKHDENILVKLGYAVEMAAYIMKKDKYELASALAKQPKITWDTRFHALFNA